MFEENLEIGCIYTTFPIIYYSYLTTIIICDPMYQHSYCKYKMIERI